MTRAEFDELFERCSNVGAWGADDSRGTLNHISAGKIVDASRLVRSGITISCARDLETELGPDNPTPAVHRMMPPQGLLGVEFVSDFFGVECHGHAHTHVDGLNHVSFDGRWYGAQRDPAGLSVMALSTGIVTRGVLIDVPRLRGVDWMAGGDVVGSDDLRAAESELSVRPEAGDVIFVRTGHGRRRVVQGPWDVRASRAGLDPPLMAILRDRGVAAIGLDGDPDAIPGRVDGVRNPVLALGVVAMGLSFLDSLALEDLAGQCALEGRWEFLCVVAPLRIPGGTGSPVNPIAIF